jgi:hypothetical protein
MSQMKTKILVPALIALMGVSAGAWADDQDDDGEVTISLMPASADESPDAVTKQISLPDLVNLVGSDQAKASVQKRAVQALEEAGSKGNREHGWSQADQAREQVQDMAENAKAKNENRGRSEERPERPEPPGPPENLPGRP